MSLQEDLAAEYLLARRDHPDVDTHRIIEIIRDRIGPGGEAELIADMLPYTGDGAFAQIEAFVWETEDPYDDD